GLEIFLVVIFNSKPLQNLRRHIGTRTVRNEIVHFFGERRPISQVKLAKNDPNGRQIVVLLLVQLTGSVQRGQCRLIILRLERGFPNIVLRLRRYGTLGEFLQELPKSVDHPPGIVLLPENQSLQLQRRLALVRLRIFGKDNGEIRKRGSVIFALLVGQSALSQGGRNLRSVGKRLQVIRKSFDDAGSVFRLDVAQPKFVRRFS